MEVDQKMDVFGVRFKVKGPQKDYTYADPLSLLKQVFALTISTEPIPPTSAPSLLTWPHVNASDYVHVARHFRLHC